MGHWSRQFSGFLGSPPWITSGTFCVLGFKFTPWVASDLFCVLGSAFSLWVFPGAFCVLRSPSFSLGSLRRFGIYRQGLERLLRDWAGQLGSCVFIFLVLPTPRSVLGPEWSLLLVCLLFFRPADPPTQYGAMVWVIGPLNRGTGL